jgi:hypothetical protein
MDNLIFVSAQPDEVFFHWQVELYLYQFSKQGIKDKSYAIFGYSGESPSSYIVNLAKTYNIFWYKDERTNKKYVPTIRPHVLKKFFKQYPHLGKNVFYHDSDIFIPKLPPFHEMLNDDIGYLSDTISYIGYKYIASCGKRYKNKYPELPDDDIVNVMTDCVGISKELLIENDENSGGAQYLLKNLDYQYWQNVESTCYNLYTTLKTYEANYPIDHHIQTWTTDMWAVLWEYWKRGGKTVVHKELDFSWAVDDRKRYHDKNIFHLAGVTDKSPKDVFFKGNYRNTNLLEAYQHNKQLFDNISTNSATYEYVSVVKELVDKIKISNSLVIKENVGWDGVYEKDGELWRSTDKKYIIFWNSTCWIVTGSQYESEISATCGGFASYSNLFQFM